MLPVILQQRRTPSQPPASPLNISYDVSSVTSGPHFHLVERDNVSLLLSPDTDVCQHKHIFVVTSAAANRELRDEGELQCCSAADLPGCDCHLSRVVRDYLRGRAGWIFLHGTLEKENLREESEAFGDILQGDFPDTYDFLSHKVIMSFIWVNK